MSLDLLNNCCDCATPTPVCVTSAKCRTIMMWRFVPGYGGFNASGPNGFDRFTDFADPISWECGPQYSSVTIVQESNTLPGASISRTAGVAGLNYGSGGSTLLGPTLINVTGIGSGFDEASILGTPDSPNGANITYPNAGPNVGSGSAGTVTIIGATYTAAWNYPVSGVGIVPSSSQNAFLNNPFQSLFDLAYPWSVTSSTSVLFGDPLGSTLTLSNAIDLFAILRGIWDPANPTAGIGALTSNFSSIPWFDPTLGVEPVDGANVLAWTFKDACVMPGTSIFCGASFTGWGQFVSGIDLSSVSLAGYDGSVIPVVSPYAQASVFGAVGFTGCLLPDGLDVTPSFFIGGGFCPGEPMAASWMLMYGQLANQYQGPGSSWLGAAQSQCLYAGAYCFRTWILYSDGSLSTSPVSCAAGGIGDGTTPINIPIPNLASGTIPSSAYPSTSFFSAWPVGLITCICPGIC